jgi:predicted  nucleic acid-binding Zn-ribbon protein
LWLISALSGTLEIEAEIESLRLDRERLKQDRERMRLENEKLDEIILQTRNEIKQGRERMKLENEKLDEIILQTRNETKRLSELESKLDGLFSKYNINLGAPTKPQQ